MQNIDEIGEEYMREAQIIESGAEKLMLSLEEIVSASSDKPHAVNQILSRVAHSFMSNQGKLSEEQTLANLGLFDISVRFYDITARGGDPTKFLKEAGLLPPERGHH